MTKTKPHENALNAVSKIMGLMDCEIDLYTHALMRSIENYDPEIMDKAFQKLEDRHPVYYRLLIDASNPDKSKSMMGNPDYNRMKSEALCYLRKFYNFFKKCRTFTEDTDISQLNLSKIQKDAFVQNGIMTIGDIIRRKNEIGGICGVGIVTIRRLNSDLCEAGFDVRIPIHSFEKSESYDSDAFEYDDGNKLPNDVLERIYKKIINPKSTEPVTEDMLKYVQEAVNIFERKYPSSTAYKLLVALGESDDIKPGTAAEKIGTNRAYAYYLMRRRVQEIITYYACAEEMHKGYTLDTPMVLLSHELPTIIMNALWRNKCITIRDYYSLSHEEIINFRNMGQARAALLYDVVKKTGVPRPEPEKE